MRRYAGYLFDLDGTLYRGARAIPGAVDTVCELKDRGAQIAYVTNNSSQTPEFFVEKLSAMGFPVCLEEIECSAYGTAVRLGEWGLKSAFVVGEPGLVKTLRARGIGVINAGPTGVIRPDGDSAGAVVTGIHRTFTYSLMNAAMQRIREGARFIATNRDATFPLEAGTLVPGAGSIVSAIATCSGQEPELIGKPNPYLVELALRRMGISPKDALVVGDRDDTDLESGRRAGCDTHLVLTGVEKSAKPGQSWSEDLSGLI